jgi:hypothetical protein
MVAILLSKPLEVTSLDRLSGDVEKGLDAYLKLKVATPAMLDESLL